ncbi:receptor-like protein EIX2 [Senna tora]|uniref:Receptor-like protein EIX2 n=1 Tax=Senna tora TaxID=362788 RepID=A0A834TGP9_9FABA|nr:receptor-like protein EIX2 [Senna tora]
MKSLESIDLSFNQLSGELPQSMSALSWLSVLNLSNNNFLGAILKGNQLQSFDDLSIYANNPYLCGAPLPTKCHVNDIPRPPSSIHSEDDKGDEEEKENILFYFVIALGFITGFWGVIGILLIKKRWRHAYFRYMENVADKIYMAIVIMVARKKEDDM